MPPEYGRHPPDRAAAGPSHRIAPAMSAAMFYRGAVNRMQVAAEEPSPSALPPKERRTPAKSELQYQRSECMLRPSLLMAQTHSEWTLGESSSSPPKRRRVHSPKEYTQPPGGLHAHSQGTRSCVRKSSRLVRSGDRPSCNRRSENGSPGGI